MKYFLLLFVFIANQAYAQSAKGTMDCTVTGSVVVASEEGKFNTYSSLKGGVKANDKLSLNYEVMRNSIYISLERDKAEKNTVINAYLDSYDINTTVEKVKSGGFVLFQTTNDHSISFLPDYIRVDHIQELFLSRYYKNDWHGIFSYVSPIGSFTETLTLNCRHTNDKMDAAFTIFNSEKVNSNKK